MNFFKKDEAIFMNSVPTENPLGYEPLPRLLKSFAVPSIITMLVSSLYNIVDQVFIGQGIGHLPISSLPLKSPSKECCSLTRQVFFLISREMKTMKLAETALQK